MEQTRKTYLIIGASSDIGMAFIRSLANGYRKNAKDAPLVLAHYNSSKEGLERVAEECSNLDIRLLQADLSQEENAVALLNRIRNTVEYPNYILHLPCAPFGYMRYKELDTDKIRMEMNIQLYSFLVLSRAFLPLMKKEYGNRVLVMLTSYVTDELPPKFMPDYLVTKYALLGAMKAAASEYGCKNLKINGISPVMMDTKFLDGIDEHIKELNRMKSPLGRIPSPEEFVPFMEEMLRPGYDKNGENRLLREADLQ